MCNEILFFHFSSCLFISRRSLLDVNVRCSSSQQRSPLYVARREVKSCMQFCNVDIHCSPCGNKDDVQPHETKREPVVRRWWSKTMAISSFIDRLWKDVNSQIGRQVCSSSLSSAVKEMKGLTDVYISFPHRRDAVEEPPHCGCETVAIGNLSRGTGIFAPGTALRFFLGADPCQVYSSTRSLAKS